MKTTQFVRLLDNSECERVITGIAKDKGSVFVIDCLAQHLRKYSQHDDELMRHIIALETMSRELTDALAP